jgi:hypothetical protein
MHANLETNLINIILEKMRWEMGFSASEIASTAFSNPKIVRARGDTPLVLHTNNNWARETTIFRLQ